MAAIHGRDIYTGARDEITSYNGAARVSIAQTEDSVIDSRIIRFDAAADMPADITSAANVSGDRINLTAFNTAAKTLEINFHSAQGYNATAGASPICIGAIVCINAADDNDANNRLTYSDLTGAGSSAVGKLNIVMLSALNPKAIIDLGDPLVRVDVIGIPLGVTPTNIVPAFLELRVY